MTAKEERIRVIQFISALAGHVQVIITAASHYKC